MTIQTDTNQHHPVHLVESPKRNSRNVYVFGATSFFNDTASEMAYWVLPSFLVSLGAGPAALGIIEGVAESIASLGKLFSGLLADAIPRRKPLVVSGYFLANAVKPLLALSARWWHVLFVRFVDRSAKGLRGTARDVMLAESVPKEKIGSAYGFLQSMDSAGAILGPLLALFILSQTKNLRAVFWWAALPGAIAVLVVLFARDMKTSQPSAPSTMLFQQGHRLPWRFYYLLAAALIFSFGNSSDMFLVLRAQQAGISAKLAPLLGLVFNITFTLASWPAGHLSDRRSKPVIAAAGYLVFAVTYFIFGASSRPVVLWAAMPFYGLYYALTSPVLRAMVVETAPSDSRGRAFGVFYFSTSIATLLSSVLTGEMWKHFGPSLPFFVSAILATVAAIMLLMAAKTNTQPTTA